MFNQEVRFPLLTHLTLGTPFGDVDFPEIQAGLFTDVGKATFPTTTDRALLGSYGLVSAWRWARWPSSGWTSAAASAMTIPRLQPDSEQKRPGFVSFFFGYNY